MLLDNGRTRALADEVGRQALRCIRCSACLNVCPVYERTGGHAYGSVYPGPIGAILNPLLQRRRRRRADRLAAVRLHPLRRLLRGLPGAHRHPGGARRPARPGGRRPPRRGVPEAGGGRHEGGGLGVRRRPAARPAPSGVGPGRSDPRPAAGRYAGCPAGDRRSAGCRGRASAWTGARDLPAPPRESFRAWWRRTGRSGRAVSAPRRDPRPRSARALGRTRPADAAGAARLPVAPRPAGDAGRPLRRAGRGLPRRRSSAAPPAERRARSRAALPGGARVVVPAGCPGRRAGRRRRTTA